MTFNCNPYMIFQGS